MTIRYRNIGDIQRRGHRLAVMTALTLAVPGAAHASPVTSPLEDRPGASPDGQQHSAPPAAAQPAPRLHAPADDQVVITQGEVVVITERASGPLDSADVLTSVNILGGDQLERDSTSEPLESLRRVPAVYVETFNQGVVSADIGIRGFNTQGDIAHAKLLIDGIPSNLHIGYTDLKAVVPLEIERLEAVKGTNDPRYGLNNIAGNINVVTKTSNDERVVRVLAGSFGTVEPQALIGVRTGPVSHTYVGSYRRTSGYRDNAGVSRFAGSGKWFVDATDRLRVGLVVRGLMFDADAPGYLTAEEARTMPASVVPYAAEDGGTQRNAHASLHLSHRLADSLSWSLKAYTQRYDRVRWVRFDADFGQQERVEDEAQYGAIGSLTYRPRSPWIDDLAVEWGIDYQLQDNLHQRFPTQARQRTGDAVRHQDFTFHTVGSYLQARARPWQPLVTAIGLRADRIAGELTDELGDATYDINDYGIIWQPKVSAVLTPIAGHSLYGNYGRTFQVGVGLGAYQTQATRLAPSINDGWELGYRTRPVSGLSARLAYWQQHATNEVRLKFDDSGESENIGETMRRGFDIELMVEPSPRVSLWAAYSRHGSDQLEPGPGFSDRAGKQLDHVPDFSAKAGVSARPLERMVASVWLYSQGDYFLTKENDIPRQGGYTLVNADMTYGINRWSELGIQVTNLLDTRYDSTVWYKNFGSAMATQHNPGDGRAIYVTTKATF